MERNEDGSAVSKMVDSKWYVSIGTRKGECLKKKGAIVYLVLL